MPACARTCHAALIPLGMSGPRLALTLPLRLCTLKAMLGDMSSSSDSCSDSFFLSLSMTLLPLFALCRENGIVLPFHLEPMPSAPRQLWSITPRPYPRAHGAQNPICQLSPVQAGLQRM